MPACRPTRAGGRDGYVHWALWGLGLGMSRTYGGLGSGLDCQYAILASSRVPFLRGDAPLRGVKKAVELQGGACAPPGQGRIKAGRLQVRASSFPTLAQGSPRSRAALPAKLPWVPGQPDGGIFFIEMAHLLSASPCNSHRLCPLCLPCFLRLLHLLHLLPIGAQENHFAS